MLHTTFTVIIYGTLAVLPKLNHDFTGIRIKFVLMSAAIVFIWNVPGVFDVLWYPLFPLLNYKEDMHEWRFRSTLDHLVWITGMMTAFMHPIWDSCLIKLDALKPKLQYSIKAAVVAVCLILGYYWYSEIFVLEKRSYNSMHPYTSFIPITLYIILRNISSRLRQYHIHLFAWMGKITLETYISQFHIWMTTLGPNENPKKLLRLMPDGYPLLNFALVSAMYVFISYRIFQVTGTMKNAFIPPGKDGVPSVSLTKRNLVVWPLIGAGVYAMALLMTTFSH
jgi:hypothetical protein